MTVTAAGAQLASGASSASANLPLTSAGTIPTKIRVAASAAACIRLGVTGVAATNADTMVQPGDALLLRVPVGYTKFAVIQLSAAGIVQVSPTEDC
ncbi:hypothetical protein [Devosia sp.]|uniref:hypothetical protein n=1 Tax=Devosia sp. TaxID=1871048 RepID=UPI00261C75AA|nr:hypothetical protein [Devosia sp.]